MNKQALFTFCPLAMKNLKNEGHISSKADSIFVRLTPKILLTAGEKEQKEEIDARHKFRARTALPPSLPS